MKKNAIINIIFGLILLEGFSCGNWAQERYGLEINNNSNINIYCYFYLVWKGGNEGVVYPDTTLVSLRTDEAINIKAGQAFHDSRPGVPITEWILSLPSDTLSVFFFSKDTLNAYSWEVVQHDYKILQRYDLSIEDIHKLYNEYDIPVITYPPTAIMKDMKMYPPYQ